jgi:polyisoprenoid-binding protein YceI
LNFVAILCDDISAKDRNEIQSNMQQEVLETATFPLISFESSSIAANRILDTLFRLTITGNLILHGVKREKTIVTQVALVGDSLRASGEFSVLQSDFGLRQYSAVGGTLKVKDELKLVFDMVARKAG